MPRSRAELQKDKRKFAKDLRAQAGYVRDNQRRLQYLERLGRKQLQAFPYAFHCG